MKQIVIVAGEESGDCHAANFVSELLSRHNDLAFSGIGGHHMQAAGVTLVSDLAKYGVTGITEIIQHAKVIHRAYRDIKQLLIEKKPDLLILVDYPGFNLRLAKFAKQHLNLKIIYYISPQIWAWKASRINTIRQYVDSMAVIFPFEKKLYTSAGIAASFVGHPIIKKIDSIQQQLTSRETFNLPHNKRLVALLPGSRTHEIERHMPVIIDCVKQLITTLPDVEFVIPVAQTIRFKLMQTHCHGLPIHLIEGNAVEVMALSDCVVVASGTASLECALLEKPMCIIYKSSLLTYLAAAKFIKVRYLGLCNVLQNKMIVPELLQYDCNPSELTKVITELLNNPSSSAKLVARLRQLKQALSLDSADCSISSLIELNLMLKNH